MIIKEYEGRTIFIRDSKILWASADKNGLEIGLCEVHGLTTSWSYPIEQSKAEIVLDELQNGLDIEVDCTR